MSHGMMMIAAMAGLVLVGGAVCAYLIYRKMLRLACIILALGLLYVWSFFAVTSTIPVTNGTHQSIIRRFPSEAWMSAYRPCMAFDSVIYGNSENDVLWVVIGHT
jgi:hypothetical protein